MTFSKLFASQPLPHGFLPLETFRILENERLLPGLTKVLRIGQEFPQLTFSPDMLDKMRPHDVTVLSQMMQVFVYEESDDPVNAGNNGTLKLIKCVPEG